MNIHKATSSWCHAATSLKIIYKKLRFRLHKPKRSNIDGIVILILYNWRTMWWESELSFIRYSWRCHRLTNFKLMTFLLNCLRRGIFRISDNQTSKNRFFSEMVLRYATGNFHCDHHLFDPCFHQIFVFLRYARSERPLVVRNVSLSWKAMKVWNFSMLNQFFPRCLITTGWRINTTCKFFLLVFAFVLRKIDNPCKFSSYIHFCSEKDQYCT